MDSRTILTHKHTSGSINITPKTKMQNRPAYVYAFLLKTWFIVYGLTTLVLIARFVEVTDRGYYLVFINLINAQTVFEMGFNYTLMQKIAAYGVGEHEMSESPEPIIEKIKTISYISYSGLKRMSLVSFVYLVLGIVVGRYYLLPGGQPFEDNTWILPLNLLLFFSAIRLVTQSVEAIFEGLGEIVFITKVRIISNFIAAFLQWGLIFKNMALWGLSLSIGLSIAITWLFYISRYYSTLKKIVLTRNDFKLTYVNRDDWKYQYKIAFSWVAGFIVFQSFNIIEIKINGPASAGVLGLAVACSNMIQSLSNVWVYTQNSQIVNLVLNGSRMEIVSKINSIQNRTLITSIVLASAVFVGLIVDNKVTRFVKSPPSTTVCVLFLVGSIINSYISVLATFIRANRRDPFFIPSILQASLTIILLISMVGRYPQTGAAVSFIFPIIIVAVPSWLIIRRHEIVKV
jgi:O-antigen/teichoic acid export membrane protein